MKAGLLIGSLSIALTGVVACSETFGVRGILGEPVPCYLRGDPCPEQYVSSVDVVTLTTGEDLDPDGYGLRVCSESYAINGEPRGGCSWGGPTFPINGETRASVGPNQLHRITLIHVASNCAVQGDETHVVNLRGLTDLTRVPTIEYHVVCTKV